jgi:nicotinamidase/pyrazinamidase
MLPGPLVFVDVDTQCDFMEPGGALFIKDADEIQAKLARLTRFAICREIAVLATACSHHLGDPELLHFPPHCMAGTPGQGRTSATACPDSVVLPIGTSLRGDLPPHLTLEKNELDVFSRTDADELIGRYNRGNPLFVVYGVATDYCVSKAVDGLLRRNCHTAIVVDAIRAIDPDAEAAILTGFARRGALLLLTRIVCAESPA